MPALSLVLSAANGSESVSVRVRLLIKECIGESLPRQTVNNVSRIRVP